MAARLAGGEAALASKGAGGNSCKLDDGQLAQLRAALEAGPTAYGWEQDQRWTLARVEALIERLSGVSYTLRGVSFLPTSAWPPGPGGHCTNCPPATLSAPTPKPRTR